MYERNKNISFTKTRTEHVDKVKILHEQIL